MDFKDPEGGGIWLDRLWEFRDQIPQMAWIVPGLIPVGFSILAGREKSGKSLMMFGSIALAVALGTAVFGVHLPNPGVVVYLALEEGLTTIASRMERLFSVTDESWYPPSNFKLYLGDEIDSFTDQGVSQLEELIKSNPGVKLVVIDTLRLLAPPKRTGASSSDYDHEYEVGSQLQRLALKHNIAIVALHHTTKAQYQDIFDSIGGTAWTKSAEMLAVLKREGASAELHVRGRSLPTTVSRMFQDPATLLWTKLNDGTSPENISTRKSQSEIELVTIEDVFDGKQKLRYKDVTKRFKSLNLSEASARRWLDMKIDDGSILKCPDNTGYEHIQPSTNYHHQPFLWEMPDGGSTPAVLPPSEFPMENGGGSEIEMNDETEINHILSETL